MLNTNTGIGTVCTCMRCAHANAQVAVINVLYTVDELSDNVAPLSGTVY
jgi:hypothetical protein